MYVRILKAGAAFLNVDPTYPIERTQYYLADCKAQYVLTQKCLKDSVKEIQNCIEIDLDNDFFIMKILIILMLKLMQMTCHMSYIHLVQQENLKELC